MTETLGNRLKELRRIKNLTQKDLADFMKTSPAYLGYLENDKKSPGTELLTNLKINLGVSIDWLLTGRGEPFITDQPKSLEGDIMRIKVPKGTKVLIEYED